MKLEGKRILLTGATGGLGRAIAGELAGRGAVLVLSARSRERLEELAAELGGSGHEVIVADFEQEGAPEALIAEAGAIDALIANAGIGGGAAIEHADADAIRSVVRVNLEVPAVMAALAAAGMRERGSGQIVFISSLAGKAIPAGTALYAATKAGLRALSLGLRGDLAAGGVGVSAVYPGFIRDAGMFADSGAKPPPGVGTATPDEVARAVADAIVKNRAEVDVAPVQQRAFANFAFHFHGVSSRLQRAAGGEQLAGDIARGRAEKRQRETR